MRKEVERLKSSMGSDPKEAIGKLAAVPGLNRIFKALEKKKTRLSAAIDDATDAEGEE